MSPSGVAEWGSSSLIAFMMSSSMNSKSFSFTLSSITSEQFQERDCLQCHPHTADNVPTPTPHLWRRNLLHSNLQLGKKDYPFLDGCWLGVFLLSGSCIPALSPLACGLIGWLWLCWFDHILGFVGDDKVSEAGVRD